MKYFVFIVYILSHASCTSHGNAIVINDTSVFYKEESLREVAIKTADYLNKMDFTKGTLSDVQVTRDTVYNVRVIVPQAVASDYRMDSNFHALGTSFSSEVFGGADINFQLCDSRFNTIKNISINKPKL